MLNIKKFIMRLCLGVLLVLGLVLAAMAIHLILGCVGWFIFNFILGYNMSIHENAGAVTGALLFSAICYLIGYSYETKGNSS